MPNDPIRQTTPTRHLTADEQRIMMMALWNSVTLVPETPQATTPGPWRGGHRCDGAIRATVNGEPVSIGQMYAQADATLAARAPDLLAEVQQLRAALRQILAADDAGYDLDMNVALADARKVLGDE